MKISIYVDLDEGERYNFGQADRDTGRYDTWRVRGLRFTLGDPEGKFTVYAARIVKSTGQEEQNARPFTHRLDDLPDHVEDVVRSIVVEGTTQVGL